MDYETAPAQAFGHALYGISVNLPVREVAAEVAFLTGVLAMQAHRTSQDFAILLHAGHPFQLHSDQTYGAHPLLSLLPEAGPRGAGIELRLHEADPDLDVQRRAGLPEGVLLQPPANKPRHGLREAVILCSMGYAWVPSRRTQPAGNCGNPSVSAQ